MIELFGELFPIFNYGQYSLMFFASWIIHHKYVISCQSYDTFCGIIFSALAFAFPVNNVYQKLFIQLQLRVQRPYNRRSRSRKPCEYYTWIRIRLRFCSMEIYIVGDWQEYEMGKNPVSKLWPIELWLSQPRRSKTTNDDRQPYIGILCVPTGEVNSNCKLERMCHRWTAT